MAARSLAWQPGTGSLPLGSPGHSTALLVRRTTPACSLVRPGVTWGCTETAATGEWQRAASRRAGGVRAAAAAECLQCGGAAYRGGAAELGCLTANCAGSLTSSRGATRPSAAAESAAAARAALGAPHSERMYPATETAPRRQSAAASAAMSDGIPSYGSLARARPIRTAPPPTAASKDPTTERAELLRWAAELGVGGGLDDGDDPLGAEGETALSRRLAPRCAHSREREP